MENVKPPLLVLTGPTASGKSAVALALCQRVDGEIVSADSMQVYRGMNIGTAKPTIAERSLVPHHMLDLLEPWETATASWYGQRAKSCIHSILSRRRPAVLCGGTGLYIDAVTRPMRFSAPADEALRRELHAIADRPGGHSALHRILEREDPGAASRLHENDIRRVIRAIESKRLTGKTQAELAEEDEQGPSEFQDAVFALEWPREELYSRIDARVDAMLRQGLEDEVRALLAAGVTQEMTSMQAIGYKEMAAYLMGFLRREDAIAAIRQGTKNYAKRQGTWLRRDGRTVFVQAYGRSAREIADDILLRCRQIPAFQTLLSTKER